MELEGNSLDDILISLYPYLIKNGVFNKGSRGDTLELLAFSFRLSSPRARISRSENRGKPFSALGELLWYLSGSDTLDFIRPYVKVYEEEATGGVIHGAYGPRLIKMRGSVNQIENIAGLLGRKPSSRRAVIQLFNAEDISKDYPEIPCTTTLQFHLREGSLHMSVNMRSNDAYLGLPHDVFCFTMIQEMMAKRLGVQLGEYYHSAGSMHIYTDKLDKIKEYISEGFHRSPEMPAMPDGNPFDLVPKLLACEDYARHGEEFDPSEVFSHEYWADIARLLKVYWAQNHDEAFDRLREEFSDRSYILYLEGMRAGKPRKLEPR